MVGLLLVLGAKCDDRSHAGDRALMLAMAACSYKEVVELLSRGADMGKEGMTALDLATKREHTEVLKKGAITHDKSIDVELGGHRVFLS